MTIVLLLALIGVPVLEIAVFIEVGGWIGLGWTLVLVLATAIAGTAMLRRQGLATLAKARAALDRGEIPVQAALDGVSLLLAGAFLLTPGFVTDTLGALLLVPPIRRRLQRLVVGALAARGRLHVWTGDDGGTVIDGEFSAPEPPPPPERRLGRG